MKALGDLLVGLAMLAVLLAAAFGLWAAVVPDTAKAARDRTVRAVDRLTEDDLPAASTVGTAVPRRPAR